MTGNGNDSPPIRFSGGRRSAVDGPANPRPLTPDPSVECYAGARYPERPQAFDWNGQRLAVQQVEREWQSPGERHFRISTQAGRFHLMYREREDTWQIEQA